MSFKLFIATTFGLIKPTAKLETANEVLLADYQMFCEFEKSAELKEYNELDLLLKSPTFLQRKREIQHLVLKGSKEEAQLAEFNKLNKNSRLQKFYDMLESDELKRFEKISASAELATYKKFKSMQCTTHHSMQTRKRMKKAMSLRRMQNIISLKIRKLYGFTSILLNQKNIKTM